MVAPGADDHVLQPSDDCEIAVAVIEVIDGAELDLDGRSRRNFHSARSRRLGTALGTVVS
jgi:hypothetical protein